MDSHARVIESSAPARAGMVCQVGADDVGLALGGRDAGHASIASPSVWRPVTLGLLAAAALLVFYLGLITLAQGWGHALQQLGEDRWFVGAIAAGFGTQVGLFVHLRSLRARAAAGGVAASTGTSTAAMLACCAHHLADVLPIIGLSGAAVLLDLYKTPLLWLGILMNVLGVLYLLQKIRREEAHHAPSHT
jgi:hypothetical protein